MGGNLVRLGGLFGLLSALVVIPAYLIGYPDAPGSLAEANSYFGAGPGTFVFFNGALPPFHVFFFLWFLGVLRWMLRRAEGEGGMLSSVELAGRIVFAALSAAGFAAEILFPATLSASRATTRPTGWRSRRWRSPRGSTTTARSARRS